jgi:UDP-N-acetylmuramate: L-alanyl-gamma-D-glutamyl-meso-diaminopimelate ligase
MKYDLKIPGKVHFAGIAGSASAPIAIMMRDKGWEVTGSDSNVWEPAKSLLSNAGVKWTEGYPPELIDDADITVFAGESLYQVPENPQLTRAKELNKPILGFANVVGEILTKENSLVITGAYGKSTTSSIIAKILTEAGVDPSFMIGGKPKDFDSGVKNTESEYSVVEGDEYVTVVSQDLSPKFKYYKPKFGLITATKWDHMDVYPTEQSYIDAFIGFAKQVEENKGNLIVCAYGENNEKVVAQYKGELTTYMIHGFEKLVEADVNYIATNIKFLPESITFDVILNDKLLGSFETNQMGLPNVENCLAAITITHRSGINVDAIKKGIKNFSGIKRRQELIGKTKNGAIVMDDFAHSPMKAKAALIAIRTRYSEVGVHVVYMPRLNELGDREVLKGYMGAFELADTVIIPKIRIKKSTAKEDRIRGKDLVDAIKVGQPNTIYMPKEERIVDFVNDVKENDLVVFMSAGGWGEILNIIISY